MAHARPSTQPATTRGVALAISRWLALSIFSWWVLLLWDASRTPSALLIAELGFFLRLAVETSVFFGAIVLALHGLRAYLLKGRLHRAPRAASVAVATTVVLLALPFAWKQAAYLSSGDGVASHPYVGALRPGLFAAIALLWLSLWLWHRALVTDSLPRFRGAKFLAVAIGALLVLCLAVGLRRFANTYEPFARHLLGVLWLALSTLLFVGVSGSSLQWSSRKALVMLLPCLAVTLLSWAGYLGSAEARSMVHLERQLARLSDRLLFTEERADNRLRIDAAVTSADCAIAPDRASRHPGPRKRVILLSVDALRRDAIDWRVNEVPLMPRLADARKRALGFERAVAPYPSTILSMGAALTGLPPHELFVVASKPASILAKTQASVPRQQAFLPEEPWFRQPAIDNLWLQGTAASYHKDAATQVDALVAELARARSNDDDYLFWAHFFEPHEPYRSHDEYPFGDSVKERYQSELAYLDDQLGRLFEALETSRALDDTLVVLFSDHGEALGELGYVGHHVYLKRWMIDVPLALWVPGTESRRESRAQAVSTASVAATVLDYLGLPASSAMAPSLLGAQTEDFVIAQAFPVRGKLLVELSRGASDASAHAVRESAKERLATIEASEAGEQSKIALITAQHRLILHRDTGLFYLHDRDKGPDAIADETTSARLQKQLRRWHKLESQRLSCALRRISSGS